MTDLKITQTGRDIKIEIDGLDISKAVRSFEIEANAWDHRTLVKFDLAIDSIEVTSLAEPDVSIMVSIRPEAEEALQALGWIKTSNTMAYTIPREDLSGE
jgi:hypothetical protein